MTEYFKIEPHAVSRTLQERNLPLDSLVKLLLVGNSGVGKSFSLNCLCEEDLFEHAPGAEGVTIDNERVLLFIPNFPPLLVYNIPGLVEAKPDRVAANKLQISMAFREFPTAKVACAFVFSGGIGGRVTPEQVTAFGAVLTFVGLTPGTASQFFTTFMNSVELDDESEDAWLKYRCEAEAVMNATLGNEKGPVIPLTTLPRLSRSEKKLGSAEREAFKRQLQIAMSYVIVNARRLVEIPADRVIVLEKEKLEADLENMIARYDAAETAMKERHEEMVKQMSQRMEQLKQESSQLAAQLRSAQSSSQSPWGDILGGVAKIVSAGADVYRASQTKK